MTLGMSRRPPDYSSNLRLPKNICYMTFWGVFLVAQCEIPPPYRAIPFRDSIAEGGIAPICLVFIGYRASIAEIPLLRGGVSHLHFACSPRGKCSEKGEGVSHPICHVETPKTPTARNRGVSLR